MITINADTIPAIAWIIRTVSERDDCSLMSLSVDAGLQSRLDVCASVLVEQGPYRDWYERAKVLEDEWLATFPDISADLSLVPWPRRLSSKRMLMTTGAP